MIPRCSAALMMLWPQAALKYSLQKVVAAVKGSASPSWREVANPMAEGKYISAAPVLSGTCPCGFMELSWLTMYLKQMWDVHGVCFVG